MVKWFRVESGGGGDDVCLGARRVLGRSQGSTGGHCAQGAEGEDGGVRGVPGRRTTAGKILKTEKND